MMDLTKETKTDIPATSSSAVDDAVKSITETYAGSNQDVGSTATYNDAESLPEVKPVAVVSVPEYQPEYISAKDASQAMEASRSNASTPSSFKESEMDPVQSVLMAYEAAQATAALTGQKVKKTEKPKSKGGKKNYSPSTATMAVTAAQLEEQLHYSTADGQW